MKKLAFAFLTALIAASMLFTSAAAAGLLGDFDGNDNVTSDDAVYLLRYTLFPEYYPLIGGTCEHPTDSIVTDPAVPATCLYRSRSIRAPVAPTG